MTGQALLIRGDARRIPLADASVDLICTSPPYFALRSYTDGGAHYRGQIGSETTPAEWLEAMWAATREMVRVLKPSGSIWINLGDKYNSAASGQNLADTWRLTDAGPKRYPGGRGGTAAGVGEKSLLGLPWAYALGCTGGLAMLGGPDPGLNLILRAEVVWHKANGLPESVTDRARRSHETWFHLTKSPRYYAAVDEIREPHTGTSHRQTRPPTGGVSGNGVRHRAFAGQVDAYNPLGKLPGSVWSIPSEPLTVPDHLGVDHYATFPSEWPRRLILGWSPPGVCTECGEGRRPVVDRRYDTQGRTTNGPQSVARRHESPGREVRAVAQATIRGYACACTPFADHPERRRPSVTTQGIGARLNDQDAWERAGGRKHGNDWPERQPVRTYHLDGWTPPPTRPAVVLDPFAGTGTTVMVARALGRIGVGIDLSADYLRLARWRVFESGHASKALARTYAERQGSLDLTPESEGA